RLRAASGWTTCGHMRKTFLPLVSKKHCPAGRLLAGRHVKFRPVIKAPPGNLKRNTLLTTKTTPSY
ncbi:hypothetical protein, partial [Enterobacter hormaechei]